MRETIDDELEIAVSRKLKEYKQSYMWLFVVLCFNLFLSLFYFTYNHYGENNTWIYSYSIIFNSLFTLIKLPLFIVAIVKVKPVWGKIVLLVTLIIGLTYFAEDLWRYFHPITFRNF